MADKLIIYLHATDLTNPTWATSAYSHCGETDSLAEAAKDREVIVIVPAEDVLLTSVVLPKMNKARLLQALPYALEEQLVADIEDLHFAIGDYQVDGSLPVAIVTREKMQTWCALLQSWQVQPTTMLPASLALPLTTQGWQVLVHDNSIVRTGEYQGFAIENDNLVKLLTMAWQAEKNTPMQIQLLNFTSHAYANSLSALSTITEDFLPREQFATRILNNVSSEKAINLLQSSFAAKKSVFPQLKVQWKVTAYLGAALLALLILYPTISYVLLKMRLSTLNGQVTAIYKQHFPKSTNMIAAKSQLQDKLENLMTQMGQNRALLLLGYVGKGMLETPGIKLKRLDFHDNQLTLELTASASEDISMLSDYLAQQGLTVKQQNVDVIGARLQATVVVE